VASSSRGERQLAQEKDRSVVRKSRDQESGKAATLVHNCSENKGFPKKRRLLRKKRAFYYPTGLGRGKT